MDFVHESFVIAPVRAAPSGISARILTRLALREQINCDQREQKVGNKHCRASIILGDSLPKK